MYHITPKNNRLVSRDKASLESSKNQYPLLPQTPEDIDCHITAVIDRMERVYAWLSPHHMRGHALRFDLHLETVLKIRNMLHELRSMKEEINL